jgi:hypothetical protein
MKNLNEKKLDTLIQRRKEIFNEMLSLSKLIRGTFFQRYSTCSRPNCSCHKGERHGPRSYVAVTMDKKQRQHYIPNDQVEFAREGIQQFHRLIELMDEITEINIELMKGGCLNEQ